MLFKDKVALVTGGASGIGEAGSLAFAREGAAVVIADRDAERGNALAARIRAEGGRALFVATDLTVEAQVIAMVRAAVDAFGGLDVAFNNAGSPGEYCTAVTCTDDNWERIMRINVTAVWQCMKHQIPEILKRGGGAIVNTASRASDSASPNMFAYSTTKHAVLGMTRSAAVDFAAQNVRVNAICPGSIDTPMLQTAVEGLGMSMDALAAPVPLKRVGSAADAAEVAVFLCSERAAYMTGAAVVVDGGMHASIY